MAWNKVINLTILLTLSLSLSAHDAILKLIFMFRESIPNQAHVFL